MIFADQKIKSVKKTELVKENIRENFLCHNLLDYALAFEVTLAKKNTLIDWCIDLLRDGSHGGRLCTWPQHQSHLTTPRPEVSLSSSVPSPCRQYLRQHG
ncbi:ATP citrate lyase subunit 1 [Leucoagaricus gongylophorus]